MKILNSISELRAWRQSLQPHEILGFVPTMGALHEGHLSLVRASKKKCTQTAVSIFVNPLQFGPKEDFSRYPRTFEKDCSALESEGVDSVFAPETPEIYPEGASTVVLEEAVSQPLCGEHRPGHFRGVTTIVLKLFNLVQPHFSFFGQKDAQQCAVIERMVRDLHVPTQIVRCPTVRESDGLALSSRNIYLSPLEREKAPLIYKSLQAVGAEIAHGEHDCARLIQLGRSILEAEPLFQIQYWDIRHPRSLQPLQKIGADGALIAVAAYLGHTRLIDNMEVR